MNGSEWAQALQALGKMAANRVEMNTTTFGAAVSACEKDSQWLQAGEPLGMSLHELVQFYIITYSVAISACDQWSRAMDVLAEMADVHVERDTITYNAAMGAKLARTRGVVAHRRHGSNLLQSGRVLDRRLQTRSSGTVLARIGGIVACRCHGNS